MPAHQWPYRPSAGQKEKAMQATKSKERKKKKRKKREKLEGKRNGKKWSAVAMV